MYRIHTGLLKYNMYVTGPPDAGLNRGAKTKKNEHEYFFLETLVSAKNGTDFTVIWSFIKIMTHVGYSEIYFC